MQISANIPGPRHPLRAGTWSLLLLAAALATPEPVHGHPSVSVVRAPSGEVFFSDLERIWVIRVDGSLAVALAGVHTHELWLDDDGSVLGEDVANVGEAYRHRVFRINPDGSVEDAVGWRPGFPRDDPAYPVTVAADGHGWALGLDGLVRRFDAAGRRMLVARITPPARWITAHPSGALVTRDDDVWLLGPDGRRALRLALDASPTDPFAWVGPHHALMKPWVGDEGEVFVPVFRGQRTDRFDRTGARLGSLPSPAGWSPTGGLQSADGSQWILEWSDDGQRCRVRRIAATGIEAIFAPPPTGR